MTKSMFPLPQDWRDAVLVGRIDMGEGPTPVVVKDGRVFDVSKTAPTVSATSSRQASTNAGNSAWLTRHARQRSRGTKIFRQRPASRT